MKSSLVKRLSLLLLFVLFLSGCTDAEQNPGNSDETDKRDLTTPVTEEDGMVDFQVECEMMYYSPSFSTRGEAVEDPQSVIVNQDKLVWYSPQELTLTHSEVLFEGDVDEANVQNACDFLSALYYTSEYVEPSQMKKNVEARFPLLNDGLVAYVGGREDELVGQFLTKDTRMSLERVTGKYRFVCPGEWLTLQDRDGKTYRGLSLKVKLSVLGKDYASLVNGYVTESDYALTRFQFADKETAAASFSSPRFAVVFDENGKVLAWAELFDRLSDTIKTRFLVAGKDGVERGEEQLRRALIPDKSLRYSENPVTTEKGKAAEQAGIKAYQTFLGLDAKADDRYFETFLTSCTDELKNTLESSGILKEMTANAKKYNVHFTLDPKSESSVQKQWPSLETFSDTEYGTVYRIERYGYLKTGSAEFNKKYGLPEEGRSATFCFYVTEEEQKLVGFTIHAKLSEIESAEELVQIWHGNWDNG